MLSRPFQLRSTLLEVAKKLPLGRIRQLSIIPTKTRLLEISGVDSSKFLQGLCTNEVTRLVKSGDSIAAAFLTPKGRLLADALLHKESDNILVEVDENYLADLKRYLTMYKLRSKVSIKVLENRVVVDTDLVTEAQVQNRLIDNNQNDILFAALDPRAPHLGARIIYKKEIADDKRPEDQTREELLVHYLLEGVAEGKALQNRIPLECNLDLLHYISFTKGCYVGQELTARTKFKGLLRKRLVPFLCSSDADTPATGNQAAFEVLSSDVKASKRTELLGSKLVPIEQGSVTVGMKLYKRITNCSESGAASSSAEHYLLNEHPIGEVVLTDLGGQIGVAMVNLETLFSYTEGNFVAIMAPKADDNTEPTTNDLAQAQAKAQLQASSDLTSKDTVLSFVATFRPAWFHGLDEKTNLQLDV